MLFDLYMDESSAGDGEGIFLIGGLVAFQPHWGETEDGWKAICACCPSIPWYKYNDATPAHLRKAKERVLAQWLRNRFETFPLPSTRFAVLSSLQQDAHKQIICNHIRAGAPKKRYALLRDPRFLCFRDIVVGTVRHFVKLNAVLPEERRVTEINFWFDDFRTENGRELPESTFLKNVYALLKDTASPSERALMGTCDGKDDKKYPGLQAADMYAGHFMDYYRTWQRLGRRSAGPAMSDTLITLSTIVRSVDTEWDKDRLYALARRIDELPLKLNYWEVL